MVEVFEESFEARWQVERLELHRGHDAADGETAEVLEAGYLHGGQPHCDVTIAIPAIETDKVNKWFSVLITQ